MSVEKVTGLKAAEESVPRSVLPTAFLLRRRQVEGPIHLGRFLFVEFRADCDLLEIGRQDIGRVLAHNACGDGIGQIIRQDTSRVRTRLTD